MITATRIGALDIAAAISDRIGSYVDMYAIEFLAVEHDRIRCWYMNQGDDRLTFEIEMLRTNDDWTLNLIEHPVGTEQAIEVP